MKKIKKEHLESLQENQKDLNQSFANIGVVESQKYNLLNQHAEIVKVYDNFKTELEEIYGSVNVNIEDGTYTDIQKEES